MTRTLTTADWPDAALIRRFLTGDERAFRQLYERHTPRLKMTLRRLLGTRAQDADDLVQETWLAGCRSLRSFRGDAQFSTWLTSIGVRATLAYLARLSARQTEPLFDTPATEDTQTVAAIDVERALALLPDQQRLVVVLHDLEGFTHEEIAAQLGVATGTSKVTLFRARATLRSAFGIGVTNVS